MAVEDFYERVAHTADLAIVVRGATLPELFTHAAQALFSMMAEPPAVADQILPITLESVDTEGLLVDWLNDLILRHEVDGLTFSRFVITDLTAECLHAEVTGGPTTRKLRTIKAATFHDLTICETAKGLEAHIVFDV